eukprot:CAMPEP_0175138104 /NCGR_PEP_ID=MMETSP0087-20121206/10166_1 /TAXON_ID=136419 /ORGANISM="Unknown Unknown, Strain D1" /LENGTH=427 /DNA_ID=CAMNT_0016420975 /DNA_START=20 /DNA_END=1303 /DNA_ORIENTATION=+
MADLQEKYLDGILELHRNLAVQDPDGDHLQSMMSAFECAVETVQRDLGASTPKRQKSRPVRGYIDGCFDIMHSGHYNAVRQAKALCDILVVGVHSDAEIKKHKGPSVMNESERMGLVKACKWADEVVFDTPYEPSIKLLDELNCDFGVHGDDISTTEDGRNAYGILKDAGRLKIIKRTSGVSTTDLVGRLLLMTKDHHLKSPKGEQDSGVETRNYDPAEEKQRARSKQESISSFLPTAWRLSAFSNNRIPSADDTVVYVDGAFDLFHVGHIEFLEKARALGTFLLVGVHHDEVVNSMKGQNYPIMSLHERVLNVLSCKWVDEVVIGAPWAVTDDMITSMNIKVVAQGTVTKMADFDDDDDPVNKQVDPYAVARRRGIYQEVESPRSLMTVNVVERIIANRMNFVARNEVRGAKEAKYLQSKVFVSET